MASAKRPKPPSLTYADLKGMARVRLKDAEVLLLARRFDGAAYLCGYAIERLEGEDLQNTSLALLQARRGIRQIL
jgi:hypothetical protein